MIGYLNFRNFPELCIALTGEFKPHVVEVRSDLKECTKELAEWLHENGSDNGFCTMTTKAALEYHIRVVIGGDEDWNVGDVREEFIFLFTDENDAFHFKFRWA